MDAPAAVEQRQGWRLRAVVHGDHAAHDRGAQAKGLKAIFPIVPMCDSYRDITFSGGQTNVSFIPLWLGLVTGTSLIPPAYALDGDPANLVRGVTTLAAPRDQRRRTSSSTRSSTRPPAATSPTTAPFWKTRSPIELLDRIKVPAFVVGGHHDLFQRGEPLVYERLKRRVPSRLIMGPVDPPQRLGRDSQVVFT